MGDLNWILTYEDDKGQTKSKSKDAEELIRYSDATDDISKRNKMDDLYYGTYGDNSQITSDTAFFDVGVEYSEVKEKEGLMAEYHLQTIKMNMSYQKEQY